MPLLSIGKTKETRSTQFASLHIATRSPHVQSLITRAMTKRGVQVLGANVLVQGIVFWQGPQHDFSPVRAAIQELVDQRWDGLYSWYLTPKRDSSFTRPYAQRNKLMREFIQRLR